jgi:hypothetical protein
MFVLFKKLNFIMSSIIIIIIIMHKWNKYFIIDMFVFTIKSVSLVFKWICHISFDSIVRLINSRLKYSIGFNFLFYLIPPCNFIFGFGPLNGWLDICFDTSSLFAISYLCVRHWLGRSWDVIYCSFFWRKTLCHLLFVKLEFTMKWTQYKKDKQFFTRKICSSSFSNANLKIYISSFDQIEYSFCQCHWKIELQNLLGQHSFFVSSFCSND